MIFFSKKPLPAAAYKRSHNVKSLLPNVYRCLAMIIILAFLGSLITLYVYLSQATTLPIKTIQVVGAGHHLDMVAIKNAVKPYATHTGFFTVKLKALQTNLLSFPWLEQVQVRKIWPDTLLIMLQEHVSIARWGTKSVLNNKGIIFTPENILDLPPDLPQFTGMLADGTLALAIYQQINRVLVPLNLSVIAIHLSTRQAWTITLSNNIVLFIGCQNFWQRLQRFVNSYSQTIGNNADNAISADLRYENGVAIKWK